MTRLVVKLQPDRDRCGSLTLYNARGQRICGPFVVAGRSSDSRAAAYGNSSRNPLLRFGDTPTGEYQIRDVLKSGKGTPFEAAQFGPNGIVVLEGVSGDAALAEANGRFHILIVGGKPSAGAELRSTAGSLRLSDESQKSLVAALRKLSDVSCEIEEDASVKSRQRVYVDPHCEDDDPQSVHLGRRRSARQSINRELLLSGAAGAIMLEIAFVALPATPAHASEAPQLRNLQQAQDDIKFLPPKAGSDHSYVRLAYGGPALDQLKKAQHQTTGQTFDNSRNQQPSDATPNASVGVPNEPPSTTAVTAPGTPSGNSDIDRVIQQQKQIDAIRSEKPPPNLTQEQLKQWQQNQQNRIHDIMNPAVPPAPKP